MRTSWARSAIRTTRDIAQQFGVSWQYVTLNPRARRSWWTPAWSRRNVRVQRDHERALESSQRLRSRFAVLIDHVAERLTEATVKAKIFRR